MLGVGSGAKSKSSPGGSLLLVKRRQCRLGDLSGLVGAGPAASRSAYDRPMTTLAVDNPDQLLLTVTLLVDSPECVVFTALRSDSAALARVDSLTDDALVLMDGERRATVTWSGLPFDLPVMSFDDARHLVVVTLVPDAVWRAGRTVWRAEPPADFR